MDRWSTKGTTRSDPVQAHLQGSLSQNRM